MTRIVAPWWPRLARVTAYALAGALALPAQGTIEEHRFQVFLDDRPIGLHRFTLQSDADGLLVSSEAEFLVRILLIPVYAYAHQAEERWVGGCLRGLASETDANGELYRVTLSWNDDGYRILNRAGTARIDQPCLKSFAYWDRSFLGERALVNSQTGELMPVSVGAIDAAAPAWLPDAEPVVGYRIRTADGETDIDVFYGENSQRWLGLQSRLDNNRVMRYVPDS